jgi:AraC family transcriptional regulator of adaptative response / DNA-3-methyladenine glycosylase II
MFRDAERCLRAVVSKDERFDGQFVTCVVTTGIYCRPSCPVHPPKPQNMRFLPTAAAAQAAGFRACKRCRPDAAPGSPEWDTRSDVVARALRLIGDGVVDREGVDGLADHLGYSRRQLERQVTAVLGAGPGAVARAQRAQTARTLLETTALPMSDVAFAAGFGSIRQFNQTIREVFASSPTELRRASRADTPASPGLVRVRLPFRPPLWPDNLFGHLAATAVPGVEEWRDGTYRRTLRLPFGTGIVALAPRADHIDCSLSLADIRDFPTAVARCRRLLDLDADPVAVDELLAADPVLRPLVRAAPGRRIPRTVDEHELALRIVIGQQVSTAAARTHAARLVAAHGEPIDDPHGGLTHLFPTAEVVAELDPEVLAMPASRRRTLLALAQSLAAGKIDLGVGGDRELALDRLAELPGVGPWTIDSIAMRALGDPDAFLAGDLGVRAAADRLGLPSSVAGLTGRAAAWRPWRSYAVQHLWGTSDHEINRMPA